MAKHGISERDVEFKRLVRQEKFILAVTETLIQALQEADMTEAELAQQLGWSEHHVDRVFEGEDELTLRTIADIAAVLSSKPMLQLSALNADTQQQYRQSVTRANTNAPKKILYQRPREASDPLVPLAA